MISLNQYPNIVQLVQVRLSTGVMSRSALDHVPAGAQLDSCFSSTQPSTVVLLLISERAWCMRSRNCDIVGQLQCPHRGIGGLGRNPCYSACLLRLRLRRGQGQGRGDREHDMISDCFFLFGNPWPRFHVASLLPPTRLSGYANRMACSQPRLWA